MTQKLKPCPCGKTPNHLFITTTSQGRKWAAVSGDCCDLWSIDFNISGLTEAETHDAAAIAWNLAPRKEDKPA